MEHPILRVVLGIGKNAFDKIVASYLAENNLQSYITFSQMFPLLFEETNGQNPNHQWLNLMSFLEPVSEAFTHRVADTWCNKVASQLFQGLNIPLQSNVQHFFAYLFKVYGELWSETEDETRQNIFRFMTDFPLSATKAVMVFHTPSGMRKSCSYALHGAVGVNTVEKVLSHLDSELEVVDHFHSNDQSVRLQSDILQRRKKEANFSGWINQGILLMNIKLTYGNEIWKDFSHCLIRVISAEHSNLPFILAGKARPLAGSVEHAKGHSILQIYHPTKGDEYQDPNSLWEIQMPFINTNFFLYQTFNNVEKLINWQNVSKFEEDMQVVVAAQMQLFDFVLNRVSSRNRNSTPFIVRGRHQVWESREIFQQTYLLQVNPPTHDRLWQMTWVGKKILPIRGVDGMELEVVEFFPEHRKG